MAHSFNALFYHAVFSTKYRQGLLVGPLRDHLLADVSGIAATVGARVIEAGGVSDHVHLLLSGPRDRSPGDLMRVIKTNTSRLVNERSQLRGRFEWQEGYSMFSVSPSRCEPVRRYIANQAEHHRRESSTEELQRFLREFYACDAVKP